MMVQHNQKSIGLRKVSKWAASFALGLGVVVFQCQDASSHPEPEVQRVRLGTTEEIEVVPSPAPQPTYIFYPDLSELGLQEGFSTEIPSFETIPSFGEANFEIEAHHLVVSASGYSLAPVVRGGDIQLFYFSQMQERLPITVMSNSSQL